MIYLITDATAAGLAQGEGHIAEVRTPYATFEDALLQAEHDQTLGRTPLRIEDDETGAVLWTPAAEETTP